MKKLLIALLGVVVIASNAYAVSVAGGLNTSGFVGENNPTNGEHVHVTTNATKIYAIDFTPTTSGGWVAIINSKGPRPDLGNHVRKDEVLVDIVGNTANDTKHFEYPEGIKCGDSLFVDVQLGVAQVFYKE